MRSLQDLFARLSAFWASQGCSSLPPCDLQLPLALMHPGALLRLLRGQPWKGAHLQTVRRPAEGRSGEHPYRLSQQLHFHVLLQGPGEDGEALYLKSLISLGLHPKQHDLRWLDEHWRSPTLGASGLGWRLLLDGLEVGRNCYLQDLAEQALRPVCLEITYYLEPLLLALQGGTRASELLWSREGAEGPGLKLRSEEEFSRHAFEVADVEGQKAQLAAGVAESKRCLEAGLAQPAYERAIICLQWIDALEARGHLLGRDREAWLRRLNSLVVGALNLHRDWASKAREEADSATTEGA